MASGSGIGRLTPSGSHRMGLVAALIVIALAAPLVVWLDGERRSSLLADRRAQASIEAAPYANALADAVNRRVTLLEGLRAFVDVEKDSPAFPAHLQIFCAGLHRGARGVRSLQVVPDGIIEYVYPLAGNEKAVGHALLQDPRDEVRADAERTITSRRLTLSGPFELLQGGSGLAARYAIFEKGRLWGLVAIILDVPPLLEESGLGARNEHLVFALRDARRRVFFGRQEILGQNPIVRTIQLPDGTWELAAAPIDGWASEIRGPLRTFRFQAGLVVLLLGACAYLAVERQSRLARALHAGEQEYGLITETVPALIASVDSSGRYRFRNKAHREWYGPDPNGDGETTIAGLMGPAQYEKIKPYVEAALAGQRMEYGATLTHKEKGLRRLSVTMVPTRTDQGRNDGFYALSVDITDRVQVDEERDRFFALTLDLLCIAGMDGYFRTLNPAWVRTLGYTRDELMARPFLEFAHPDDRASTEKATRELAEGRDVVAFENRVRCADGSYKWVLWNCAAATEHGLIYAVGHDITNRKRSEEALRKSEARLEQAQRMAALGNFEMDFVSSQTTWSDEVYRIFGVDRDGFRPSWETVLNAVHPADRETVWAVFQTSVDTGKPFNLDHRLMLPDSSVRHVRQRAEMIRGETGGITGMIGTVQDVTEYKELEEQFHQAQKLESVGRLAGGVAHDFNNLLTVINGYSELVLQRLGTDDPARAQMAEVRRAGDRAAALTQQLLAFSRRQVLKPAIIDLNAVVSDLERMLRRLIGEDVELIASLKPELGRVLADPGQINQVLMNLVVNARDAMPNGGKLFIETANVELERGHQESRPGVEAGPYVLLAVSDTGIGMDRETQRHIFEPFFTTKATGAGTGLGLSTVYGIVRQSGGSIWVYSEIGEGTTFKIYLPRIGGDVSPAAEPGRATAGDPRGVETILVVEDQQDVRKLALEALRSHGYRVLEAANAGEALLLCERHPGPIHLMLTDVVMPGMSGRELGERVQPLRPAMTVVYMSGYTDDVIVHRGALAPGVAYIQKPFVPEALAMKIRESLGPPRAPGQILVVDDEAGVRGFLRQILCSAGYEVTEAANGREAIQRLREGRVDLVVLDLVMPEKEGLETIPEILQERPGTRIIAMSGAFSGQFLKSAEMMGARATVLKPIRAERILETVRQVLEA